MQKSPAFQFYPQDFLSSLDVQMMTAEEVGIYVLLLANSWIQDDQGYLVNDEITLAFIARISVDKWREISPKILRKFKENDGKIYNERLVLERTKQVEFSLKQAENGAKGGRPRNPKKPKPIPNLSQALAKKSSSSSSSSSSSLEKENKEKILVLVNSISSKKVVPTFLDFLKERVSKKNPATPKAVDLMVKKINSVPEKEAIEMIEKSIESGWTGIFKSNKKKENSSELFNDHKFGRIH